MHCTRCGSPVDGKAAFCGVCGAPTGDITLARPRVVTVLAVLQFIGGVLAVALGLITLASGSVAGMPGAPGLMAALFLGLGIPQLVCGIGLWTLRPWGRTLQIVLAVIGLLAFPFGTILSALILWLFLEPGAKALFSGRPVSQMSEEEAREAAAFGGSGLATALTVLVVVVALVVPLLGILAAIVVPGLARARMSGNEASAIGSLRAITSAQLTFAATCGRGGYAGDLADLATPEPGGVPFVSPDLSSNPTVKSGYVITLTGGAPMAETPVACNGARVVESYFVAAEPVTPGSTGARYFATTHLGEIYESTTPIAVTQAGTPAGATPLR